MTIYMPLKLRAEYGSETNRRVEMEKLKRAQRALISDVSTVIHMIGEDCIAYGDRRRVGDQWVEWKIELYPDRYYYTIYGDRREFKYDRLDLDGVKALTDRLATALNLYFRFVGLRVVSK